MLTALLAGYLMSERERYFRAARPVDQRLREQLQGFFRPELLEYTRVHEIDKREMRNPDFYPTVEGMGFQNLPDFATLEAITYEDVIVFTGPVKIAILFHELVHAEQYSQLGVTGYARRYVLGFMEAGTYEAIPLEIQAYGLQEQFVAEPRRPFSVEEEVARWISEGRF